MSAPGGDGDDNSTDIPRVAAPKGPPCALCGGASNGGTSRGRPICAACYEDFNPGICATCKKPHIKNVWWPRHSFVASGQPVPHVRGFGSAHPDEVLEACVRQIDNVCKWLDANGFEGAAAHLHEHRDRYLLPLAKAAVADAPCVGESDLPPAKFTAEMMAAIAEDETGDDGEDEDRHSTEWDVGDDEDGGFCVCGPWRATRAEAERDLPAPRTSEAQPFDRGDAQAERANQAEARSIRKDIRIAELEAQLAAHARAGCPAAADERGPGEAPTLEMSREEALIIELAFQLRNLGVFEPDEHGEENDRTLKTKNKMDEALNADVRRAVAGAPRRESPKPEGSTKGGTNMRATGEKPDPVGHKGMAGERSDDTGSNEGGSPRSRGAVPGLSGPNAGPAPFRNDDPDWWKKCPWRCGMRARVTSHDVLKEWRDRLGTVKGIMEHEVKLELDGDGRPEAWFRKSQVAPTVDAPLPSSGAEQRASAEAIPACDCGVSNPHYVHCASNVRRPASAWSCDAVAKLAKARGFIASLSTGEAGDEQAFEWTDFYESLRKEAAAMLEETAKPASCRASASPPSPRSQEDLRNDLAEVRLQTPCPPELSGVASPVFSTDEEATAWTAGYLSGRRADSSNAAKAIADIAELIKGYESEIDRLGKFYRDQAALRTSNAQTREKDASPPTFFIKRMQEKLVENAHKGGWKNDAPHLLLARVFEEVAELTEALKPDKKAHDSFMIAAHHLRCAASMMRVWGTYLTFSGKAADIIAEAADVANMVMMIADNAKHGRIAR